MYIHMYVLTATPPHVLPHGSRSIITRRGHGKAGRGAQLSADVF